MSTADAPSGCIPDRASRKTLTPELYIAPIIGLYHLAPLALILGYDQLYDPTGVTKEKASFGTRLLCFYLE